jgi:hypothetical protein
MQTEAETERVKTAIFQLFPESAETGKIAEKAVTTWRAVEAALSPIIGKRGVAALYKRSLYLTCADFPWLSAAFGTAALAGEYSPLKTALSQQTASNAAAASGNLLQTFYNLLVNLIGASLTGRLLAAILENPSSGAPAQDISP